MRYSRILSHLSLLVVLLLAGCGPAPQTPDAAAEAARAFLQARAASDAAAVYGMMTQAARESSARSEVARYLRAERFAYGELGQPYERDPGWLQVAVRPVQIDSDRGATRWPEYWLTLHYENGRWRVAWAEPLAAAAMQAYANNRYVEQLALGKAMTDIDPYDYRGYLEQHFAHRELRQTLEAERWLAFARMEATPLQMPDVLDAMARHALSLGNATEALSLVEEALQQAAPLIPQLYSPAWQVDSMVVKGRALAALGDLDGARAIARQGRLIDPQNGTMLLFEHQMARVPAR